MLSGSKQSLRENEERKKTERKAQSEEEDTLE